jgi:hypothetical protein
MAERDPDDRCGCPPGQPDTCAPKLALSREEEAVLRRMRALREEFRCLKDRLKREGPPAADRVKLEEQLERLRLRFRECQAELARANREKMIRLGHEP